MQFWDANHIEIADLEAAEQTLEASHIRLEAWLLAFQQKPTIQSIL